MFFARRQLVFGLTCAGACAAVVFAGAAQTSGHPKRSLRGGFPTGGTTDILARLIAQRLGAGSPTKVVVDTGRVPAAISDPIAGARRARWLHHPRRHHQFACDQRQPVFELGYDPVSRSRDHADRIESQRARGGPSSPFKSLADIIAEAKAKPGSIAFASAGNAHSQHLSGELLKSLAKSTGPRAVQRKRAGHIQDVIGGSAEDVGPRRSAGPHIQSGKLARWRSPRASGRRHFPTYRRWPRRVCRLRTRFWQALFAPAGTPQADSGSPVRGDRRILKSAEMQERLASLGMNLRHDTGRTVDVPESGNRKVGTGDQGAGVKID